MYYTLDHNLTFIDLNLDTGVTMIPDVSRLTFVSHPDEFIAKDDDFIARVPVGIADRQALFRAMAKELKFPAYLDRIGMLWKSSSVIFHGYLLGGSSLFTMSFRYR